MVEATIQNLPIDLKRTMLGNIVLAGGTTLLPGIKTSIDCLRGSVTQRFSPGLADRLQKELRTIAPPSVEIRIVDPTNRHLTTWTGQRKYYTSALESHGLILGGGSFVMCIGGSVLASMKTFNYHWISKEEYDTYGVELLHATRE